MLTTARCKIDSGKHFAGHLHVPQLCALQIHRNYTPPQVDSIREGSTAVSSGTTMDEEEGGTCAAVVTATVEESAVLWGANGKKADSYDNQ